VWWMDTNVSKNRENICYYSVQNFCLTASYLNS